MFLEKVRGVRVVREVRIIDLTTFLGHPGELNFLTIAMSTSVTVLCIDQQPTDLLTCQK